MKIKMILRIHVSSKINEAVLFLLVLELPLQTAPVGSSGGDAEVTRGPRRGLPLNNLPIQSLSVYGGRGFCPQA